VWTAPGTTQLLPESAPRRTADGDLLGAAAGPEAVVSEPGDGVAAAPGVSAPLLLPKALALPFQRPRTLPTGRRWLDAAAEGVPAAELVAPPGA
jgi:hypothetical protein